jgi:hypothetical protein
MPLINYINSKGERLPGVTTVISANLGWNKQQLMYWANQQGLAGKNHRDTAQAAADAGTLAHAMIEAELTGKKLVIDAEQETISLAETAYLAWLEWCQANKFQVIASEKSLISEKYQFGGTIDIARVRDKRVILDLKTSNGIYPDHRIQVAAYGILWDENFPDEQIEGYEILQIGKERGNFAHYFWPELNNEREAFLHLLVLHNLKKLIK